ncbi:uncharacterized protein V6R79_024958 [Siganus canaliculatus]
MTMAAQCSASHYWDPLIKKCIGCYIECKRPLVASKCISYCEAAKCKAQPGHYYDLLLKKCVKCAEVCGRHPAECSPHCQTSAVPLPKLLTTAKLEVNVVSHVPYSRGPIALGDPTFLLYPLLALCLSLVFTSLSLALVVFLRGSRIKPPKPGSKEIKHIQECVVQPGQETAQAGSHLGQRSKDFPTNSRWPIDHEPLDESSPTETCVCVHCFPDLKALRNHPPLPASVSLYPQSGLHSAHIPNGGPVCTEGNSDTSGQEVKEGALVR